MNKKIQLSAVLKLVDAKINSQVFRKISQATAGMPANLQKSVRNLNAANTSARTLNNSLQKTKRTLNDNERAARLFLNRVAQFAILLPTFATLNRAIQGSVKFLFEFDSALRDIVRIDIAGLKDQMEQVGEAALQTATEFGVTGTEVLATTRIFKQAGFDIAESQDKARAAILATQISTLNSAQAVEVFIAASKQFVGEGENSIAVLDKLAKVEDVAAVNASDVAEAFRTGGNSLAEFSKSIDDSIGLIAALREQTRKSGREIGTFFKTLQTRIFAAGDSRNAVEALGISVENLDGTLRPTLDVLNDLKGRFDELSEAQAANAAKAIAGVRQFESLIGVLNSLDRANELAADSSQAAGTADEKRAITDAKLERQLGKLVAQGQQLAESLGDAGFEDTFAGALKSATALLKVFTSLVDTVGDLGGSLAPLLALGGFKAGQLAGVIPKGGIGNILGGGSRPGSPSFIGPQQPNIDKSGAGPALKKLFAVTTNSAAVIGKWTAQTLQNITISQAQGIQTNVNTKAFAANSQAVKANIASLRKHDLNLGQFGKSLTGGTVGMTALTIAASTLPAVFDSLGNMTREVAGEYAGTFVDITGAGATMAAQFAFLGPVAAALAGAFGVAKESVFGLADASEEYIKSKLELSETRLSLGRSFGAEEVFRSQNGTAGASAEEFLANLSANIKNADVGQELAAKVSETLQQATKIEAFQKLGVSATELRDGLFANIGTIQSLVSNNQDFIETLARQAERTEQLDELNAGLADGTLRTGDAFRLLTLALGAGTGEIVEATGNVKRLLDFKEFKNFQEITELADNIRTLRLEVDVAKLGPEALADSVVRLQSELAIAERSFQQASLANANRLGKLVDVLDEFSVGLDPAGDSATEFFKKVLDGTKKLDASSINEFTEFIEQLPPQQKKAAKEIETILRDGLQLELDIQNKRNDLLEEQNARAKALFDAESQAAQNAFESLTKFNAELRKFGDSVTTDVLSAFQNIGLEDVSNVLGGSSNLDAGIQELIQNAFGDPVTKAQNELGAAAAAAQAEITVLSDRLMDARDELANLSDGAEKASLVSEILGLELAIESKEREALVAATEAKIKVLEEEKKAEEEAAEAAKARAELLEKLADASRNFENELGEIEKGFKQFQEGKIADLLEQEAGARENLQQAQSDVIDSTANLADAYQNLIQSQLQFNNAVAEAQLKSRLLFNDIVSLNGGIVTFSDGLSSIRQAFVSVLNDSNITLEKRIDLERQLADETLQFLQQARDSIIGAGVGVFGQSAQENQQLSQGIQGLQFVAEQLGGSFESFLQLSQGEINDLSSSLLNLPVEFRQQILDALSFLPSTANIGGFSPDQLREAIGQVGAGISPEAGLPSIEELTNQQVQQLQILQDLALQDAQLQISQVVAAQEQVEAAEAQLETSKLLEERAREGLAEVRDAVVEEKQVLDMANEQRRELLNAVVAADDKNTLFAIEKEAQLFAEQNSTFREVGDNIVRGISSAIGARLAVLEAAVNITGAANGYIPNFAGGNLSPMEAAGLLKAASREKRAMPGGASLAVANTSEAIIPMNRGFIPNFQDGNLSPISAGISAIKQINETVVAAISRSVTQALSDLGGEENQTSSLLTEVIGQLRELNNTIDEVNTSNLAIQTNTAADTTGTATTGAGTSSDVTITLQSNQNNTISVTGLESLPEEITNAVREAAVEQVDAELTELLDQLDSIFVSLQERGIISSFGQSR